MQVTIRNIHGGRAVILPKALLERIGFDTGSVVAVPVENGAVSARPRQADAVRAKLTALGITPGDVENAIMWARQRA